MNPQVQWPVGFYEMCCPEAEALNQFGAINIFDMEKALNAYISNTWD